MISNQANGLAIYHQAVFYFYSTLTIEYQYQDQYQDQGLISNLKQVKRWRRMVDALASRADEGRGKAAKSLGQLSSKQTGDTRMGQPAQVKPEHPQLNT